MTNVDSNTANRLKTFIERLENLENEKKDIQDVIKEVFEEAKGEGFDVKIIRQVLRVRKMKAEEREEQEALLEMYMNALQTAKAKEAA
jgi:uncharacterized protein (UPF0335 family)